MQTAPITTLFLDIGDVLLTNGFEHQSRKKAAQKFNLDLNEINERHQLVFSTYELGKISLNEYLNWVVFYRERDFTPEDFREFIFEQSQPFPQMIAMVRKLKSRYGLKIAALSNEARELNAFRIHRYKLDQFIDFFVSSCFVHMRKPDPDIFRLALDMAQTQAGQVVYIENTSLFVEFAEALGIKGIVHRDYSSTLDKLKSFGLVLDSGGDHEVI
jgi:HAD superfamily hydrolase (TIGR01509 family)